MMTNEQLELNKKVIAEMRTQFDKLLEINSQMIASIPDDKMPNKSMIQLDLSKIKKLVAKGDLASLNKLSKKYAGHNNK